jgi:hypothetical protein
MKCGKWKLAGAALAATVTNHGAGIPWIKKPVSRKVRKEVQHLPFAFLCAFAALPESF